MSLYGGLRDAIRRGFDRGCRNVARHFWYVLFLGFCVGVLLVALLVNRTLNLKTRSWGTKIDPRFVKEQTVTESHFVSDMSIQDYLKAHPHDINRTEDYGDHSCIIDSQTNNPIYCYPNL